VTLTLSHGPLSGHPPQTANYTIDGPQHRLLLDAFPRRIRALLGGETVLDTRRGMLLHETGILPQLYVPTDDVGADLLGRTAHSTHCPFKGNASYWTVRAGDRTEEDAVWGYEDPKPEAAWLRGYVAFYWERMDAWFDEDEEVEGHLRDPYHRVDVRASTRHVRVLVDDEVVAETRRPKLLSETGLPNRYYISPRDVRDGIWEPSATHTVCPYKGTASYRTLRLGERRIADAAWLYPVPYEDAAGIRGRLSFLGEGITVEVDGEVLD